MRDPQVIKWRYLALIVGTSIVGILVYVGATKLLVPKYLSGAGLYWIATGLILVFLAWSFVFGAKGAGRLIAFLRLWVRGGHDKYNPEIPAK